MSASVSDLLYSSADALSELARRRLDPALQARVETALGKDLPAYMTEGPVLCLAQSLYTPNFETLRFLRHIRELGLPATVSFDSKGLFVSQNATKRALAKLPICLRVTQKGGQRHEHYQYLTVVDFNASDGRMFSELVTKWGEPLIDFHGWLSKEMGLESAPVTDDAQWIDRHGRGDLLEHYAQFLALFVTHGILFETYEVEDPEEVDFIESILRPACLLVQERFGHAPLVCELSPIAFESPHFWLSYPADALDRIRARARAHGATI